MSLSQLETKLKNSGFEDEQVRNIKEIIHFIGVTENLAWRENEGVLREDIHI